MICAGWLLTATTTLSALPPETYYNANVARRGYTDDASYGPFNIGFTFTYFGANYTQFYATSNGLVMFGTPSSSYSNTCLPTMDSANNMIAAFWDDIVIHANGGVIFYQTIGTSPNRKCVVQFTNMGFYADPTLLGTFSVVLYETSNEVQIEYRILVDPRSGRAHGDSATIGLENLPGTSAVQVSCNTQSITSEQAIRFVPNGSSYTLNTSAVYDAILLGDAVAPTIPTLVTPAENSTICQLPTFEWTPSESVTSYTFKLSTNSTLSGSTDTNVGTATTYTPLVSLTNNQAYYWAVFANGASSTITWSEIHKFTASSTAAPVASPQTVWTTLGSDQIITLNGVSCGAAMTAKVTSLPANGELYQYDNGVRGAQITAVPTDVTDNGRQVIFYINDGVIGTNRGNFQFKVNANAQDSGAAQLTLNVYPAPSVSTASVSNIGTSTATCGGTVNADNGYSVTERGVCWSTTPQPTYSGSHTSDGTGTGAFVSSITGLTGGTTYYVRAYAINSQGIAYGSQVLFATNGPPVVTTAAVTGITGTGATGGGNVTSDGNQTVTTRGVCWSTAHNPTTSDSYTTDGGGTGSFTSTLSGLLPGTTYYVRAYATNSLGTSYGSEVSFNTSIVLPTVTTASISSSTATTASGGGNVTDAGGGSVTARGVCWNTAGNPTTSNSKTTDGTGAGSFSSSLTSLSPATTYYVRAYATNSAGTAYGSQVSFTTGTSVPTVVTNHISLITSSTAKCNSDVTSEGGAAVTAYGICWNTSGYPTIADQKTTNGSGVANFTSDLTGLTPATTYHARAYATNSVGTAYGNELSFITLMTVPTVTTAAVTMSGGVSAATGGNVTVDGGASVMARGVVWGTSPNPVIAYDHTADGAGVGSFTSNLTGLTGGTRYYVRAYATNYMGTGYGDEYSFTAGAASLRVTVSAPTTEAKVGDDVPFNVSVENVGTADATSLVLTIPLPANTEFVGARLVDVQQNSRTNEPLISVLNGFVTITFDSLVAGQNAIIELILRALQSGVVTVTATASTDGQSAEAKGEVNTEVKDGDQYVRIITTPVCGVGIVSALAGVLFLSPLKVFSRWRRRRRKQARALLIEIRALRRLKR